MKMKSFIKQFAAFVTGDTAEVQAQKNYRKAEAALKTQIAKLNGDTLTFEEALETAEENAKNALVNSGQPIDNREQYVRNLIDCDNEVEEAKDALKEHLELIEFLKGKLAQLDVEVDA